METTQQFIERMGLAAEEDRLPRIAGRIMGLLLVEEHDVLALEEIAERLLVSRASISTNTRQLVDLGVLERVTKPGERRDYFQLTPEPGKELLKAMVQKLDHRSRMIDEVLTALDGRPGALRRLRSLAKFYRTVAAAVDHALEELGDSSEEASKPVSPSPRRRRRRRAQATESPAP